MKYSAADFEAVVLAPGMRCQLRSATGSFQIESVRQAANGIRHVRVASSGDVREVPETDIIGLEAARDLVEQLTHFSHRGVRSLLVRERVLSAWREAQGNCRGLETILGARINFFEHQVAATRKVLSLPGPRALLGDEVGLGKTIECGLVLSALMKHKLSLRVLVTCPGTLCQQWLAELYSKFHGHVFHLPSMHGGEVPSGARAQRVIVSFRELADPQMRRFLEGEPWDVLVVDEAHRIPSSSSLFEFVRNLTRRVPGLLLLSATPVRSRAADFVKLLSFLNPDAFAPDDVERLERLRPLQAEVERLFEQTDGCTEFVMSMRADAWCALLSGDQNIATLAEQMRGGDPEAQVQARDQLLRYVADAYRIDDRIIRNRRAGLGRSLELPTRVSETFEYRPEPSEERALALLERWCNLHRDGAGDSSLRTWLLSEAWQRAASSAASLETLLLARRRALNRSPGRAQPFESLDVPLARHESAAEIDELCLGLAGIEGEETLIDQLQASVERWKRTNGRTEAVVGWIKDRLARNPGEKILVFTSYAESLGLLWKALSVALRAIRTDVQQFHVGLEPEERERSALAFVNHPACRVLLCDESGGEGRNFQVANWVLHADLPWDLGAIEQRIGRLDRIGRKGTVCSVGVRSNGVIERNWSEVVWSGFGIGKRTLAGLEFLAEELQKKFTGHATAADFDALHEFVAGVSTLVAEERARIDADEERRLDSARFDLDEVRELISELKADAALPKQQLLDWAAEIGVDIRPHGAAYEFDFSATNRATPHSLRAKVDGTFERWLALKEPSLQFFAWGHPLVEWLVAEALDEGAPRTATIQAGRGTLSWRGCRALVVCEPDPDVLETVPPHVRGRVAFVARPEEHCVFVRADGTPEQDRSVISELEAMVASKNPASMDPARITIDAEEHARWTAEVRLSVASASRLILDRSLASFGAYSKELEEEFAPERSSLEAVRRWRGITSSDQGHGEKYEKAIEAVRRPRIRVDSLVWLELTRNR